MSRTVPPRRYLDHPATSWPKPAPVLGAMVDAIRDVGAAAGRGIHADARRADAIREGARNAAARIIGVDDAERVALVGGATLGLNVAIHGLVEPGWHVIATASDHNATLRPLHWLASRGIIDVDVVPCDASGLVNPEDVAAAWRPATRMLVFSHASNVTGTLQPAAELVAVARERGGISILDAAQTAGMVALPRGSDAPDVVVAAGHKWLQGPEGIAILAAREGVEPRPLVQGGTGSASEDLRMPERFVDRLEAGTPDLAALAGLSAAIGWGASAGIAALAAHGNQLAAACRRGLATLPGVRVLGAGNGPPIVGFTVEDYDPADVAVLLEQVAGVQARAGFHCAALVHRHLGTARGASGMVARGSTRLAEPSFAEPRGGGSVRVGFGPFNTPDDVRAVVAAVAAIVGCSDSDGIDIPIPMQVPRWQE